MNISPPRARFEPPSDQRLLIVGQELSAIGGFPAPLDQGYTDSFPAVPAGVTTYASLPWLFGVRRRFQLWAGPICAQCIVENPLYRHSVLAMGLCLVGQEQRVAQGRWDGRLSWLARWLRSAGRPVFLRIGYEFDGSWNHYDPGNYVAAFRRIGHLLRQEGANNVATVWQAATSPVNGRQNHDLSLWYPGREWVDWMGYSWFLSTPRQCELTEQLLQFAASEQKPVMVCEAAPQGYDLARLTHRDVVPGPDVPAGGNCRCKTGEQIWDEWFAPFFTFLQARRGQVKAVAYINTNWDIQRMWGPPYRNGYWGDSRLQANSIVRERWLAEMERGAWLQADPELFATLGAGPDGQPL